MMVSHNSAHCLYEFKVYIFISNDKISVSIWCRCNAAQNSVVSTYIREFIQRNVRLLAIIDVDEINQWNGSKNGGLYKWSIISINWIQSSKLYCRFCFLLNIFLVCVINCLNWMSKWTLPFDWHLKLFSEIICIHMCSFFYLSEQQVSENLKKKIMFRLLIGFTTW